MSLTTLTACSSDNHNSFYSVEDDNSNININNNIKNQIDPLFGSILASHPFAPWLFQSPFLLSVCNKSLHEWGRRRHTEFPPMSSLCVATSDITTTQHYQRRHTTIEEDPFMEAPKDDVFICCFRPLEPTDFKDDRVKLTFPTFSFNSHGTLQIQGHRIFSGTFESHQSTESVHSRQHELFTRSATAACTPTTASSGSPVRSTGALLLTDQALNDIGIRVKIQQQAIERRESASPLSSRHSDWEVIDAPTSKLLACYQSHSPTCASPRSSLLSDDNTSWTIVEDDLGNSLSDVIAILKQQEGNQAQIKKWKKTMLSFALPVLMQVERLGRCFGIRHGRLSESTIFVNKNGHANFMSFQNATDVAIYPPSLRSVVLVDEEVQWTAAPELLLLGRQQKGDVIWADLSRSPTMTTTSMADQSPFPVGKTSDWWSLGLTLACFLKGQCPKQVFQVVIPSLHQYLSDTNGLQWEMHPREWIQKFRRNLFGDDWHSRYPTGSQATHDDWLPVHCPANQSYTEGSTDFLLNCVAMAVFDNLVVYERYKRDLPQAIKDVRKILGSPVCPFVSYDSE